ncbi:MAG TPA: MOSC domain-containing protein [Ilumatobacteraceae bacterium]|nr:MOSC domain-containing protein [Ilumatobacteraceae bacterium]
MHISELWRYPAKSMLGQQYGAVRVGPLGIEQDRQWAVRDEQRGAIVGAKKIGELMNLEARFVDRQARPGINHIEITLPDGTTVCSDDADIDARVSQALGRPVTLWPLQDDRDHYRRAAPDSDDFDSELRSIFGLTKDEPFPDLSIFPAEIIEFESPPGTYYDVHPLTLISTGSLDSLRALLPDSELDWRRFRPSMVIDLPATDDNPWPELALCSKTVQIGDEVLIDILPDAVPRCVMVTRQVAELPQDRGIMRTLVREAAHSLGIYATIRRGGTVNVGDEVRVLDD